MDEHRDDPLPAKNAIELLNELRERLRNPPMRWGHWSFDAASACLDHDDPSYEVRVFEMKHSANVLDVIMQVAAKTWATDATVADLVRALQATLHPQANLCSMGVDRGPIDVTAVIASNGYAPK